MGTNGKKGITIAHIEVRNFRRITIAEARIDKEHGLVRVTGKNRAGKTSLLRGIAATLGGAKLIDDPENTIRDGAEEGAYTRIRLTNGFTVQRKFSPAAPKGYLTVEGADGGSHGQKKLDEWVGRLSFDPLAFFELDDKKRASVLLSLAEDTDLPAKLDAKRQERQQCYDDRTPLIVERRKLTATQVPEGVRPEPLNLAEDMRYLQQFQGEQEQRAGVGRKLDNARHELRVHEHALNEIDSDIARLEQKIAELRGERELTTERVEESKGEIATLEAAYESMPDRTEEIRAVHEHIAEADTINEALAPWLEYDRAQERLVALGDEIKSYNDALAQIDAEINELVANAGIPVPGLTFDEHGMPLIGGKPFSAASGAERTRTAVAVALAANPDLRICLLDEESNGLDLDALAELDRLATEHQFQIWAVRIGLEGPGEIVVEDGVAHAGAAS